MCNINTWTLRARTTRVISNHYTTDVSAEGPEIKGIFDVVKKSDYDKLKAENEALRKALEEAREGVSAHLDNLQHYFENKCIPTAEEVNQFSNVDSQLALALLKFKKMEAGNGK